MEKDICDWKSVKYLSSDSTEKACHRPHHHNLSSSLQPSAELHLMPQKILSSSSLLMHDCISNLSIYLDDPLSTLDSHLSNGLVLSFSKTCSGPCPRMGHDQQRESLHSLSTKPSNSFLLCSQLQ